MKKRLLFTLFFFSASLSFGFHPLKISKTDIVSCDDTLNINTRLFADDLSQSMSLFLKRTVSYEKTSFTSEEKEALINYYKKKFQLEQNGTEVLLSDFLIEIDSSNVDFAVIIVKCKGVLIENNTNLVLSNDLLFDRITEQKNLVYFMQKSDVQILKFEQEGDKQLFYL